MSTKLKCIKRRCQNEALPGGAYCAVHQFEGTPGTGVTDSTQPSDPPIVISGGSVTIEFDKSRLRETADGKHSNPYKRIRRVEITGDGIHFAEDTATGRVTVKIYYGDE